MYGVILWSDPHVKKAVIWCEDQMNLAYYEAPEHLKNAETCFFDAGDYVEFDMFMDDKLCRASNAQIVVSSSDPRLPLRLEVVDGAQVRRDRRRPRAAELHEARVIQLFEHLDVANSTASVGVNRRG